MPKYHVIIRPLSACRGVYACDAYGNVERLDGTFCICGENTHYYASSHADGQCGDFDPHHLDPLEENEYRDDMEFPDDEAALRFVDWFDNGGFDPWRVDFVWAYDGGDTAEREVYWM